MVSTNSIYISGDRESQKQRRAHIEESPVYERKAPNSINGTTSEERELVNNLKAAVKVYKCPQRDKKGYQITETKALKQTVKKLPLKKVIRDFPGGAVVKNPPANAEDTGLSPGPG